MKATALEILSEPLSLLLLLSSLALATLASAFHYHQFGEATRMARDAGFSALLTGTVLVGTVGMLRTLRRELETGTAQMALSRSVSRPCFLLAKFTGVLVATFVFALTVAATSLTVVRGAEIGGELAAKSGDIARLWGPSLALAVAVLVAPLVLAAALNRLARWRFVPTVFLLSCLLACAGCVYRFHPALTARLLPVGILAVLPAVPLVAAAAAGAVRLKMNAAAAGVALAAGAFLPALGNYCLADALSRGGSVPWSYVGLAALSILPIVLLFLILGFALFREEDLA